jgi:hypothetical protein
MTDRPDRAAALQKIRQNIAEHGFHIYVVTGSALPHFGYTIGLSRSIGAELILAGAYFYKLDEVSKVIRTSGEKLRSSRRGEVHSIQKTRWGNFSLRPVDISWAKGLMLGAFDFFATETIEARQIVPDQSHWTIEIPDLSLPWSANAAPGWQWMRQEWTFPVPPKSVAITNLDALRGGRVTEVMRWEEDEWEIFAGAGPDTTESERRVVPLSILLAADPSLVPAVDLAVGTGLWRDGESSWHPWRPAKSPV